MSFDVYLEESSEPCPACGRGGEHRSDHVFNLTHNVNGIVDACLRAVGAKSKDPRSRTYSEGEGYSWARLEGWAGKDAAPILTKALEVACSEERHAEFIAMEPPNGWGHLSNVVECMRRLLDTCRERPSAKIETSG